MLDLMYFMIAVLIGYSYSIYMNIPVEKHDIFTMTDSTNELFNMNTPSIIKDRILKTINSDNVDKRERIVRLLIELDKLEDIDVFYENHEYIRSYIFNIP